MTGVILIIIDANLAQEKLNWHKLKRLNFSTVLHKYLDNDWCIMDMKVEMNVVNNNLAEIILKKG